MHQRSRDEEWRESELGSSAESDSESVELHTCRSCVPDTHTPASHVEVERTIPKPPTTTKKRSIRRWLVVLLCDTILLAVMTLHFSLLWLSHVHSNYLSRQHQTMRFTPERREQEITYYTRPCSEKDITASSSSELFLDQNATVEDAYQHQLLHGFTIFPNVLDSETMETLRNHIVLRNTFNATDKNAYSVIENDHRYSFGLSVQEPSVYKALMQLSSNHSLLKRSLDKILGHNPALIELSPITSTYGAKDQFWHDDVTATASAVQYGRSFAPSYSVFIPLQDTTPAMGATCACPGTHYCAAPGVDAVCNQSGFVVQGPEGYWKAGDALLMNQNAFHKGGAHVDALAKDRVMLILTFAPRPQARAESRQLSQQNAFSMKWDVWGHTLQDLSIADTVMQQPWAWLRAAGLYRLPNTDWGIDYFTTASMRMANHDTSFTQYDFGRFMETGGIQWLPKFLQGCPKIVEDEEEAYSWYEFYLETLHLCSSFVANRLLPLVIIAQFTATHQTEDRFRMQAVVRLIVMGGMIFFAYRWEVARLDQSSWATDIRLLTSHSNVFTNQHEFGVESLGPTTFPTRQDVLIETRYGSEYLALYNDFVGGHPGNRVFDSHVVAVSGVHSAYPEFLRNASAHFVVEAVHAYQGRFLYQGPLGDWVWLDDSQAVRYVKDQLWIRSHPLRSSLATAVRNIISDSMYGRHRNTIMAEQHAIPFMKSLESSWRGHSWLSDTSDRKRIAMKGITRMEDLMRETFLPSYILSPASSRSAGRSTTAPKHHGRRSSSPPQPINIEPEHGAWLAEGDVVECLEDDGFWYPSAIDRVTAHGVYHLAALDKQWTNECTRMHVRPFRPYTTGELLDVYDEDTGTYCSNGTVINVNDDDTVDVVFPEQEIQYGSVPVAHLRRSDVYSQSSRS